MPRYRPSRDLHIPTPCNAGWESMPGDSRVRHCATCDHDVLNTAAMTPSAIEAMLSHPGPLPCLRIARRSDGSWLTATAQRATPPFSPLAAAAMGALISAGSLAAAAQRPAAVVLGRLQAPQAVLSGQVLGTDGKPAAHSTVYLNSHGNGTQHTVTANTDDHGAFRISVAPGAYELSASSTSAPLTSNLEKVTLHPGEQTAPAPLRLEPIFVTAGITVALPPPPPPPKPKAK